MNKTIAVITARGGSKRIPRKNIKEFLGQPMIKYAIDAAIKSGIFDTIMVSTDDAEIAQISKQYGAEIPFMRSEKTSNDFATTLDVLLELVHEYKKIKLGIHFTHVDYQNKTFSADFLTNPNKIRNLGLFR